MWLRLIGPTDSSPNGLERGTSGHVKGVGVIMSRPLWPSIVRIFKVEVKKLRGLSRLIVMLSATDAIGILPLIPANIIFGKSSGKDKKSWML